MVSTLEIVQQLAVDLAAGQKAEDYLWQRVVEQAIVETREEDWVRFDSVAAMYIAFGLTPPS